MKRQFKDPNWSLLRSWMETCAKDEAIWKLYDDLWLEIQNKMHYLVDSTYKQLKTQASKHLDNE